MEIIAVRDHYEIIKNGEFFCSCDNWDEVLEEMEKGAASEAGERLAG